METTTKPLAYYEAMPIFEKIASADIIAEMKADEHKSYLKALKKYRKNLADTDDPHLKGLTEDEKQNLAVSCAEAYAEGFAEGLVIGFVEVVLNFMKLGLPLETIAQGTGLSVAKLKKL